MKIKEVEEELAKLKKKGASTELIDPASSSSSALSELSASKVTNDIPRYYQSKVSMSVVKLFDDVVLPEYKHAGDACMDIRAYRVIELRNENGSVVDVPDGVKSFTMFRGWTAKIGSGFAANLPEGYSADVKIRSGISYEEGLILLNGDGKVDCLYTGEFTILLGKITNKPTVINLNDRIAQFELVPQIYVDLNVVDKLYVDEQNQRKDGGLGHSGLK